MLYCCKVNQRKRFFLHSLSLAFNPLLFLGGGMLYNISNNIEKGLSQIYYIAGLVLIGLIIIFNIVIICCCKS